jgi:NhaP-type Na+/H+ or K+/H+ antiporter
MSLVAAEIVEWDALIEVILVSLSGGVGLIAAFSIAVAWAVRFVDFRRDGRPVEAGAFAALALIAMAVCIAAIVYGIWVMAAK